MDIYLEKSYFNCIPAALAPACSRQRHKWKWRSYPKRSGRHCPPARCCPDMTMKNV